MTTEQHLKRHLNVTFVCLLGALLFVLFAPPQVMAENNDWYTHVEKSASVKDSEASQVPPILRLLVFAKIIGIFLIICTLGTFWWVIPIILIYGVVKKRITRKFVLISIFPIYVGAVGLIIFLISSAIEVIAGY